MGNREREEFLPFVDLMEQFRPALLTDTCDESALPETIVVLQSAPDEFPGEEFLRLYETNPLARFVCVYGPWCDADGRNRDVWPFSIRVPVWRVRQRFHQDARTAILPLTAGRDETFRVDFAHCGKDRPHSRGFQIDSPDRALREMLADALGIEPVDTETEREGCWNLFDIDPWNEERRTNLVQSIQNHSAERVLPLVGFPEPTLLNELSSQGLNRYWPKLAPLGELMRLLIDAG